MHKQWNGLLPRPVAFVFSGGASLGVVATSWSIAAAADYSSDGKPDILWQNTTTGERVIWLMNGTAYASSVSLGVVSTDWVVVR